MGVGTVVDGATTITWNAGKNVESFGFENIITVNAVGAFLIDPASFTIPLDIRCDNTFASGGSGAASFLKTLRPRRSRSATPDRPTSSGP
ncbi:hypothetical protein ABZW18_25255 [Streptomyces sp. NPDC004647]|uniref:hypothetical protein n=1 Tax=Streptomyces sp. NPDC004647 TaxID=3154671 RepID=UPI0033B8284E